jgi:hypothetical protein
LVFGAKRQQQTLMLMAAPEIGSVRIRDRVQINV